MQTVDNFTGSAAVVLPADEEDLFVDPDSCMVSSLLAEQGLMIFDMARLSVFTSMLRSESIHFAHCAKRCKMSWS